MGFELQLLQPKKAKREKFYLKSLNAIITCKVYSFKIFWKHMRFNMIIFHITVLYFIPFSSINLIIFYHG